MSTRKLLAKLSKIKGGIDRREEVLEVAHKVKALLRGLTLKEVFESPVEAVMAVETTATYFDRYEYSQDSWGLRLVLSNGVIQSTGIKAGDCVRVLSGEMEGEVLVVEDAGDCFLRLADSPTKIVERDVNVTIELAS